MFTAALLTIVRTRKQLEVPPTDEWIKVVVVHIHREYYSAKKEPIFFYIPTHHIQSVRQDVRNGKKCICISKVNNLESKEVSKRKSQNRVIELHIETRGRVFSEDVVSSDVPWRTGSPGSYLHLSLSTLFNVCEIWNKP